MAGYYHEIVLRAPNGEAKAPKIIGSAAENIDEAAHERGKIAKEYHPNQIISLVNLGKAPR